MNTGDRTKRRTSTGEMKRTPRAGYAKPADGNRRDGRVTSSTGDQEGRELLREALAMYPDDKTVEWIYRTMCLNECFNLNTQDVRDIAVMRLGASNVSQIEGELP